MSGELACTYAALILSDDGQDVTADKMDTVIKAAGVTIEPYWTMLFGKFLATKPVDELLANVGAGGGGAHSGASGGTVSEEASSCHVNDRGRPRSVGLGSCGPALRRRRLGRRRCVVTSSRKIILFGVVAFLNANWGLLNN